MKIIADMNDAGFYQLRAIESIQSAEGLAYDEGNQYLRQAVGLLLLALAKRNPEPEPVIDKEAFMRP